MRNKVLQEILDETPEETKAFVDVYTKIIMNLNSLSCSINYNLNKETMLHISKTQAELIFKEVEARGPHEEFSEVHIVDELYATIKYRDNELYLCLESDQAKEIDVEGLGCEYTLSDL